MAFWRCRPSGTSGDRQEGVAFRPGKKPYSERGGDDGARPRARLTEECLLKGELKFTHRTGRLGEDVLQMLDGVAKRIGVRTGRFLLAATQSTAQQIQSLPQTGQQVIHRLQRPGQAQRMGRGPDTGLSEQRGQQRPQPGGRKRMPWQHRGQKQGKRAPAAAALAALGTIDPLAADRLAGRVGRIVAVEQAVPVQRLGATAAGTALLFERKSSCWSAGSSRTK